MAVDPPVDFIQKQASRDGNYPFSISASDLMENFRFATMDVPDQTPSGIENALVVTEQYAGGGKSARSIHFGPTPDIVNCCILISEGGKIFFTSAPNDGNLFIPTIKGGKMIFESAPNDGIGYIPMVKSGTLQWIETEEC